MHNVKIEIVSLPQPTEVEGHKAEEVKSISQAVDVTGKRLLSRALRQLRFELIDLLHPHITALPNLHVFREVHLLVPRHQSKALSNIRSKVGAEESVARTPLNDIMLLSSSFIGAVKASP